MSQEPAEKPLLWVASSKRDLMAMPDDVIDDFGYGLDQAQKGKFPDIGKVLRGFGGRSVIELIRDDKGGTFRAVYTVRFPEIVAILHCFQKKSKSGIETPKQDVELIHSRLRLAEEMYKEWKKKDGKNG
jgi:phage-related protein